MFKRGFYLCLIPVFYWTATASAQFNFDSPSLGEETPAKEAKAAAAPGAVSNISFGGLFDVRYMALGGNAPGAMVHVDELVVTANIGDNISILAEHLLPTSRLAGADDIIQDDHGFVFALFSNIPYTPQGTAFKIGRFRFKWGIDAVLDSPSNMLYPLTKKNLGFITDRGLELSGFWGPVDYSAGLADGPEFVDNMVMDGAGNELGTVRRNVKNNSLPLLARLSTNVDFSRILRLGTSYFDGVSWPYINDMTRMPGMGARTEMPGGMPDTTQLVYKQKWAADSTVKWKRLDLQAEYSQGKDRFTDGTKAHTRGCFGRLDYAFMPGKLLAQAQYDRFDDGLPLTKDEQAAGAGVQIFIHNQAFIRLGYILNRMAGSSRPNVGFTQFYLPF
ncbi:MAG: hypothetical protein HY952_03450 [Elusimicrobia bacterium]|nr:hypothetical protein [Elusimicrobiota bacterium]